MAWFSEELLEYIEREDHECDLLVPENERSENEEARKLVSAIVSVLVRSRHTFDTDAVIRQAEQMIPSSQVEERFDEYYTRFLLGLVPDFADRTAKLSKLLVRKLPSDAVNVYSSEAARCYIFGFWTACLALCRAALSVALREKVREKLLLVPNSELEDLIDRSGDLKILDGHMLDCAHRVRRSGNAALHPKPDSDTVDEREAFEALTSLRAVLLHLYE